MARILAQRLGGSDFGLATSISGLAWSDHGSMAQIMTQWLRGSDLEMVLAQDLSSVARWLGSISAHEDRIKQLSHKSLFKIQNLKFECVFFFFFPYWSMPVFFFFLSFFPPFFFFFFFFLNIANK
jgi:hypothetical protein